MEKLSITYALVKATCDKESNYLDCFLPFAIKALPTDKAVVDLETTKKQIMQDSGLSIPIHTLTQIFKNAQRKGYIQRNGSKISLSNSGITYLDSFESSQETARRLNALYDDIIKYLHDNDATSTPAVPEIEQVLFSLINNSVEPLAQFFGSKDGSITPFWADSLHKGLKKSLVKYIMMAEEKKPEFYKTLQDVYYGLVVTSVLNLSSPSKIENLRDNKFKRTVVYFDTNFTFSLLGLHPEEFNAPAKDLYNLLKENHFDCRIFGFTLDEISRVLNNYADNEYLYTKYVRVDSLSSSLKNKG